MRRILTDWTPAVWQLSALLLSTPAATHVLVPLCHSGALLGHVMPAIKVLGVNVLERMILRTISNFFGHTGLAGQRFEGSSEVRVSCIGNHAMISPPPNEAKERTVALGLGWVLRRRKEPPALVWLDRFKSAAIDGTGTACG